jgi:hypothetical protein
MSGSIIALPATTRGGLLFGLPTQWLKGRLGWQSHPTFSTILIRGKSGNHRMRLRGSYWLFDVGTRMRTAAVTAMGLRRRISAACRYCPSISRPRIPYRRNVIRDHDRVVGQHVLPVRRGGASSSHTGCPSWPQAREADSRAWGSPYP